MSARSTRVSRRRSADPGADEEDTVQETQLESTQSGRGEFDTPALVSVHLGMR